MKKLMSLALLALIGFTASTNAFLFFGGRGNCCGNSYGAGYSRGCCGNDYGSNNNCGGGYGYNGYYGSGYGSGYGYGAGFGLGFGSSYYGW